MRAECGYTPSGEYGEPASREAFAQGSNRGDFAKAFFTDEVKFYSSSLPHFYTTAQRTRIHGQGANLLILSTTLLHYYTATLQHNDEEITAEESFYSSSVLHFYISTLLN